jgi:hypothetical protein
VQADAARNAKFETRFQAERTDFQVYERDRQIPADTVPEPRPRSILAIMVGALLAVGVGLLGTVSGLDRDRAFYPIVTIVVASFYALFAAMAGSTHTLVLESLVGAVFVIAAIWGFKSSLWLVAAALAAHGIFDLGHSLVIPNSGVPSWWPEFCSAFDVTIAVYLAFLLRTGRLRVSA